MKFFRECTDGHFKANCRVTNSSSKRCHGKKQTASMSVSNEGSVVPGI